MNLIYYIFLLLIIFLLLLLIKKNEKLSPIKIKIYMRVVIVLFIFRYLILFLLCIVKSGVYIHIFKSILYLNFLCIPLIVLALDYVYLRWDKISFNINYIIGVVILLLYLAGMYFIHSKIVFDVKFGYIIKIKSETVLFLGELIIIGLLLLFSLYYSDKPNSNKKGVWYVISGLAIVIIEDILYLGGFKYFPYPIISDGIFLILINLGVNTFKMNSGMRRN